MEADDFDGCGIRPFATGKDDPFYAACQWHDKAYTTGSWAENSISRHQADLQFYQQMKFIAGDNWRLQLRAWAFYKLARLFGHAYWEGVSANRTLSENALPLRQLVPKENQNSRQD